MVTYWPNHQQLWQQWVHIFFIILKLLHDTEDRKRTKRPQQLHASLFCIYRLRYYYYHWLLNATLVFLVIAAMDLSYPTSFVTTNRRLLLTWWKPSSKITRRSLPGQRRQHWRWIRVLLMILYRNRPTTRLPLISWRVRAFDKTTATTSLTKRLCHLRKMPLKSLNCWNNTLL